MKFDQVVNSILESLQLKYLVKVVGSGFSRRINGTWKEYWAAETVASSPEDAIGHVFHNYAEERKIPERTRKRIIGEFAKKVKVKKISSRLG